MSIIDLVTADMMSISSKAVISKKAIDAMTKLTSPQSICFISSVSF